jgi:hypothetical protein
MEWVPEGLTPLSGFIVDHKVKTTGFSRSVLAELMLYHNSNSPLNPM